MDGIEIRQWDDLVRLASWSTALAAEHERIGAYAARWACRPDGFEPSPICLLRPLGAALESLRCDLDAATARLVGEWRGVAAGVSGSAQGLGAADTGAHDTAAGLAAALGPASSTGGSW